MTHRFYVPAALVRISAAKRAGASETVRESRASGPERATRCQVCPHVKKKKPSSVDEESRKWQLTGPIAPLPTRRAGAADFEHASKHTQTHSLFLLDSVESLVYVTGLATFNHYRQDNSQPSH